MGVKPSSTSPRGIVGDFEWGPKEAPPATSAPHTAGERTAIVSEAAVGVIGVLEGRTKGAITATSARQTGGGSAGMVSDASATESLGFVGVAGLGNEGEPRSGTGTVPGRPNCGFVLSDTSGLVRTGDEVTTGSTFEAYVSGASFKGMCNGAGATSRTDSRRGDDR